MTTFQSREAVRDELVSLYVADGTFQEVYGYFPGVDEISGKTPLLVIRSRGTSLDMAGALTNRTEYRFSLTTFVLADENYVTSAAAEDALDTVDLAIRQVIRDNAGGGSAADMYRFEGGFSTVDDLVIGGQAYIVETRIVIATLVNGRV